MFDNNQFANIDLSNVEFSDRKSTLMQPGKHIAEIKKAEIKKMSDNRQQVEVHFENDKGETLTAWYTVYNPKSTENARIDREKLKAMLVYAGHINPDKPGDGPLVGLKVGVSVKKRSYTATDGSSKDTTEIGYTFDPHTLDPVNFPTPREVPAAVKKADPLADAIPF